MSLLIPHEHITSSYSYIRLSKDITTVCYFSLQTFRDALEWAKPPGIEHINNLPSQDGYQDTDKFLLISFLCSWQLLQSTF